MKNNLKHNNLSLIVVLLLLSSTTLKGQESAIKLSATLGLSWRSTVMNFFNFRIIIPDNFLSPYDPERNIQGMALNHGILLTTPLMEIEYFLNLRYDVVSGTIGVENLHVKAFLIDHNLNIMLKRKLRYGIGFSTVNHGKVIKYNNPTPETLNIEFNTINFVVQIPLKRKIELELKALYIPKGYPYNKKEKYMSYGIRAYRKFSFKKKDQK